MVKWSVFTNTICLSDDMERVGGTCLSSFVTYRIKFLPRSGKVWEPLLYRLSASYYSLFRRLGASNSSLREWNTHSLVRPCSMKGVKMNEVLLIWPSLGHYESISPYAGRDASLHCSACIQGELISSVRKQIANCAFYRSPTLQEHQSCFN
jgi:hypothetical protein